VFLTVLDHRLAELLDELMEEEYPRPLTLAVDIEVVR
jgi:hypothetical protein